MEAKCDVDEQERGARDRGSVPGGHDGESDRDHDRVAEDTEIVPTLQYGASNNFMKFKVRHKQSCT